MITPDYMSDEEAEEHQSCKRFVVHSPHFRSEGTFRRDIVPYGMKFWRIILFCTVLNQLVFKLDRRLEKASRSNTGFRASERMSGSPLDNVLPKKFVRWAIREDIQEPERVQVAASPRRPAAAW